MATVSWQIQKLQGITNILVYNTQCSTLVTTPPLTEPWKSPYYKEWNMLRQLSSSPDNGQTMVIYPSSMKHAPSVVIV